MKKVIAVAGIARAAVARAFAPSDTRTKEDLMVADPMYNGLTIEQNRANFMREEDADTLRNLAIMVIGLVGVTVALAIVAASPAAVALIVG